MTARELVYCSDDSEQGFVIPRPPRRHGRLNTVNVKIFVG